MKFLHTGSTLLNLALSGQTNGGWPLGRISNVIGDFSSGKTLIAVQAMTLGVLHPPPGIDTFHAVYGETEAAFDKEYAARLGMPVKKIEFHKPDNFNDVVDRILELTEQCKKKNHAGIYVLDSLDALGSINEDEEGTGYDLSKQKQLGPALRKVDQPCKDNDVHFMIISQIREVINRLPFQPKWKRAGGKALDFWSSHILWLYEVGKLKVKKKGLVYGIEIQGRVTKNKISRNYRDSDMSIIFEYGIDDVYDVVTFLTKQKLKRSGNSYEWKGDTYTRTGLIELVESNPKVYAEFVLLAQEAWDVLETEAKQERTSLLDLLHGTKNPSTSTRRTRKKGGRRTRRS